MEYIQHSIQLFQNAIQMENEGRKEWALQTYKQGINELQRNIPYIHDQNILNQCHNALQMYGDRVKLLETEF